MAEKTLAIEVVANVTQRLAVLLSAGVSPPSVWGYLAESQADAARNEHPLAAGHHTHGLGTSRPLQNAGHSGRGVRGRIATQPAQTGLALVLELLPSTRRARAEAAESEYLAQAVLDAAADAGLDGGNVAEAIRAAVNAALAVKTGPCDASAATTQDSPPKSSVNANARVKVNASTRLRRPAASSENMQRVAEAWLALAAAWAVAQESGAPLAATLRQLANAFRDQAQLERDLAVALSGPRATARMVGLMPAIGVVFGSLMGFDTLNTLLFTMPGLLCLIMGVLLMACGARWSATLVRRAARGVGGEGQLVELTAIAMSGGASTERALRLATDASARYSASAGGVLREQSAAQRADSGPSARATSGSRGGGTEHAVINDVLALSRRAGVPAAELLRSEAQQARLSARSAGQQRAARLAVSLMIPLGLCVLPSFMLLGVVPLLISVLSSTLTFI